MNLTLITVNFNNARATLELLRSLEQQTAGGFDVIVVDNDSRQEDRALLGSYAVSSPLRLDIIYSDRNRGFSGGNNSAVRKAMAQGSLWLFMINNDTVVPPDFIASLLTRLPIGPAIVGVPLREGSRTAYSGYVRWLRATLGHENSYGSAASTSNYVIGAAMAVHRDVFERVGLLDERYFLYFEDAEFSLRVRRAGIPIHFLEQPVVEHAVSSTTKALGDPLLLRYHMRNSILFHRTHGPLWANILLPLWVAGVGIKQLSKLLVGRSPEHSRAILAGIRDAILGRWGRISSAHTIAIECESLEDTSWGVARMIRGLLEELVLREDLKDRVRFVLYFKSRVPDEPWIRSSLIRTVLVRAPSWLPVPISFSLYYYLMLPLRLWWDRPSLTYWPNYMLPLIAPRPSLVMLTEDIWHQIHNPRLAFRFRIAYAVFSRFAARTATAIMAISRSSKQGVQSMFRISPSRIEVNELAVAAPVSSVQPMPGPYILFVGQAFERRHLRETIDAFASIAPAHPTMRLIAIGPDKYDPPIVAEKIRTVNSALGRPAVQHIDRVTDDDLARFYAGATSFVYVSDVEAFGLPPLEALANGVPSVLADVPLNREIYGDCAFYVTATDQAAIADAIERSITDHTHRAHIKQRAQSITARYTWKAHADRMVQIFTKLLGAPL